MGRLILFSTVLLVALGFGLTACAPAGGDAARSAHGPITAEEISQAGITSTAFDAVRHLRPEWLHIRGRGISERDPDHIGGVEGESDDIRVYLDGQRFGYTADALNNISVMQIQRIRRISAREATTRYGAGHFSGVIEVETN